VVLDCTHERALDFLSLDQLVAHAKPGGEA